MANKEEIIAKIDELLPEDAIDEKIELMEKVSDSSDESNDEEMKRIIAEKDAEIERLKAENEELKLKYKERFLKSEVTEDEKEDDVVEELKEDDTIDVKEI